MTIRSEINKDDWSAYVQFIRSQTKMDGKINAGALLLGLFVGAFIGFGSVLAKIAIDFSSLLIGSFGTVFFIIILSRSRLKKIKQSVQPSDDGVILGPCLISVGDEGVKTSTPNCETLYRWHTVRCVKAVEKHIFIVVDNVAAITIPRRSFSSADEQEMFLAEIHKRSHA